LANLSPSENLYRAFRELDKDGRVAASGLRFPNISVNRANLCEPEDVLIGRPSPVGVCSFYVRDIPLEYIEGTVSYSFVAVEDPVPDNPAHAEIRCLKDSVYLQQEPPPPQESADNSGCISHPRR